MFSDNDDDLSSGEETGSDELLSSDDLHLPASANVLIRLHALRAWLTRRQAEASLDVGVAVQHVQEAMQEVTSESRPRRHLNRHMGSVQPSQEMLVATQQRLSAYDEAALLLEDCVAHTTVSERLLVEYYLSLEEMIQATDSSLPSPWLGAMVDVLRRVEQIGLPGDEEE